MPKGQKKYSKRKLAGGGFLDNIFGSKYKPANFEGKTVEDVLKMKLPFSITEDFFQSKDIAQIPINVQEAIQFMADLNDRKKVFERCYQDKMSKSAHSAIHPKAVEPPKEEPVVEEEKEEKPEPPKKEEPPKKPEAVEEEKKEPMDGGRRHRRRRSTKKHRKHRRSKKSYKK